VLEALRARKVRRILLTPSVHDGGFLRELQDAAPAASASIENVDRAEIDRIVPGQVTQGVIAEVEPVRASTVEQILTAAGAGLRPALLLVLDQIQDPRNLGSLLRTAEAAGAHGVIVTDRRSAPLTGVVTKASAGAIYHLPIASAGNLARCLAQLQREGIWTIGLTTGVERTIFECDLTAPSAIVIGGEGGGLRRLTQERVDMTASIPMLGQIESLNASVAGAVALFEAVRQRIVEG